MPPPARARCPGCSHPRAVPIPAPACGDTPGCTAWPGLPRRSWTRPHSPPGPPLGLPEPGGEPAPRGAWGCRETLLPPSPWGQGVLLAGSTRGMRCRVSRGRWRGQPPLSARPGRDGGNSSRLPELPPARSRAGGGLAAVAGRRCRPGAHPRGSRLALREPAADGMGDAAGWGAGDAAGWGWGVDPPGEERGPVGGPGGLQWGHGPRPGLGWERVHLPKKLRGGTAGAAEPNEPRGQSRPR